MRSTSPVRRSRPRAALAVVGLVLALVAAACGTRVTYGQVSAGGTGAGTGSGFASAAGTVEDADGGALDSSGGLDGTGDGDASVIDGRSDEHTSELQSLMRH